MSKPSSSLEFTDPVVIGIPLGQRRAKQSDRYRQVRADQSGTVEKPPVRRVLGVELSQASSNTNPTRW